MINSFAGKKLIINDPFIGEKGNDELIE